MKKMMKGAAKKCCTKRVNSAKYGIIGYVGSNRPYDRNGCHCTGREVTFPVSRESWCQYENADTGELFYAR